MVDDGGGGKGIAKFGGAARKPHRKNIGSLNFIKKLFKHYF